MGTALEAFDATWGPVVESLMPSDVPLGVLQSGGIDSSLVTLEASRAHQLPLFTAGFSEASHDETVLAQLVAARAGRPLQVVPVELEDDAPEVFQRVVHHFDGQLADSSAFAVYRLSQEVRRHVTVVLGGDGADEFFGGYHTYRASRVANALQPLVPSSFASWLAPRFSALAARSEARMAPAAVAARFLWGLAATRGHSHAHWRRLLFPDQLGELYGPALQPLRRIDPLAHYVSALDNGAGTLVDRCLLADQRYYLPADLLLKVDAMSMAHGLEVRVPFLERRMMDLAGSLAAPLLSGWRGPPKHVLRRALQQRGAAMPVVQGAKRGFQVPVARLLRGPLNGLATRVLERDTERLAPLLAPDAVRKLWRAHARAEANHGYIIWTLLTLGVWLEQLGNDAASMLHPQ
jgi:asparagine synthase (glutamine-hydrolysing)